MWLDALGWTATGLFSSSYFFEQPAALRKIQAGATLLWVTYGLALGSAPVVVANLVVGVAAVYTSFRAALDNWTRRRRAKRSPSQQSRPTMSHSALPWATVRDVEPST